MPLSSVPKVKLTSNGVWRNQPSLKGIEKACHFGMRCFLTLHITRLKSGRPALLNPSLPTDPNIPSPALSPQPWDLQARENEYHHRVTVSPSFLGIEKPFHFGMCRWLQFGDDSRVRFAVERHFSTECSNLRGGSSQC